MEIHSKPQAIALAGATALTISILKHPDAMLGLLGRTEYQGNESARDIIGSLGLVLGMPRDVPMGEIKWEQAKPGVSINHLVESLRAITNEWNLTNV